MDGRHLDNLRAAADRAKVHVARCRAELDRFDHNDDGLNERTRQKLTEDLRRAEIDAAWAQTALTAAIGSLRRP